MKLALVVIGDGRAPYLRQAVRAARDNITHPITARIMVNDEADESYCAMIDETYPDFIRVHTHRSGMAGAVQAGFTAALSHDPDYVVWVEEDMVLTRPLPLTDAIAALEANPSLAQMCFRREPWDPSEGTCQLDAITQLSTFVTEKADYTTHDYLFSLNPCLIPRRVLEIGWPSGPIGVGNEDGITRRLLDAGFVFGSWGHAKDGQSWCRHIGNERAAGWRL